MAAAAQRKPRVQARLTLDAKMYGIVLMKKLIAFDLDGTLAESKLPIDAETANLVAALLARVSVAIISGGDWPQFQNQVLSRLPPNAALQRLFILPTTGTKLYHYEDGWRAAFADVFSDKERKSIIAVLDESVESAGLHETRIWGERIEDRGSQITFSGLGQLAPLSAKAQWDPDFAKRKKLQALLRRALPTLSVNIGGSTSIDITRSGVDKAYGMQRLSKWSGISFSAMLFFGDALFPGGNDYPVREARIDTISVRDVTETRTAITALTAVMSPLQ